VQANLFRLTNTSSVVVTAVTGGGNASIAISGDPSGSLKITNSLGGGNLWMFPSGNIGINVAPQAMLHIKQSSNTPDGSLRLERVDTGDFWSITMAANNYLQIYNQGVASGLYLSPAGDLILVGATGTGTITYGGAINHRSIGTIINTDGSFIGPYVSTGSVFASGGFSIQNVAGMTGVTDTFTAQDGRTVTVRGGIITQIG
jgi:hypothetical protein